MKTKKDYLEGKITFDEYYVDLAKAIGVKPSEETIEKVRKSLANGDEHLNSIPLKEWDRWVLSLELFQGNILREEFRKRGDAWSIAGGVCMLKAICKYYASMEIDNNIDSKKSTKKARKFKK